MLAISSVQTLCRRPLSTVFSSSSWQCSLYFEYAIATCAKVSLFELELCRLLRVDKLWNFAMFDRIVAFNSGLRRGAPFAVGRNK